LIGPLKWLIPSCDGGLLAELADAMDSKSIGHPSKTTENQQISTDLGNALRSPCADADRKPELREQSPTDPALAELLSAWPKLAVKERRQLVVLVRSMVET
jgi:hypothetical protein